jgi:hypothetical protein
MNSEASAVSVECFAKAKQNRHRERSEAISALNLRLPRRCAPRSDEVRRSLNNHFETENSQ